MPVSLVNVASDINSFNGTIGGHNKLNGAINNSVTTITVNSTSVFPTSGTIEIDSEYISYTGTTATTFTGCTRGAFNTTAASHNDAVTVRGMFISAGELDNRNSILVRMKSDYNGQLCIDFSRDNTNWICLLSERAAANVPKIMAYVKGGGYVRTRIMNHGLGLATIGMCTCYGAFNDTGLSAPLCPFSVNVAEGNIPGHNAFIIRGQNGDVGTTVEDLWTPGGTISYLSSAETISVVSASANDTSAGTGARSVKITGLDADYDEIDETVTMNGTTPVVSTKSFLRINRAQVTQAGSSGWNEGNITLTASVATTTQSAIRAQRSVSEQSQFTVPCGKKLYILRADLNCARVGTDSAIVDFRGYCRLRDSNANAPFRILFERRMETNVQNTISVDGVLVECITQEADVVVRATSTKTATEVRAQLFGLLVAN